jgi:hypothetical protein
VQEALKISSMNPKYSRFSDRDYTLLCLVGIKNPLSSTDPCIEG